MPLIYFLDKKNKISENFVTYLYNYSKSRKGKTRTLKKVVHRAPSPHWTYIKDMEKKKEFKKAIFRAIVSCFLAWPCYKHFRAAPNYKETVIPFIISIFAQFSKWSNESWTFYPYLHASGMWRLEGLRFNWI